MMRNLLSLLVAGLLILNLSGCFLMAAGAAGAGAGWVYFNGQISGQVNKPINKVRPVTLTALQNMNMSIEEDKSGIDLCEIKAKDTNGDPVYVKLIFVTDYTTKIEVRVGLLGDERRSRNIIEAIERNLGR